MLNVMQSHRKTKKGTSQKSLRLCVSALRQVFVGLALHSSYIPYTNSKSTRYLRWLVFGSSTYVVVRLRRLNPRRLDFILDLILVLRLPMEQKKIYEKSQEPCQPRNGSKFFASRTARASPTVNREPHTSTRSPGAAALRADARPVATSPASWAVTPRQRQN